MSRITGGIFSRPRGKTGGIVFGAARGRSGKVVTTRELVPPSNPNTAAQQTQRTKFSECLDIVRRIGSDTYQNDWNRAIGQLPGFQSMMSIYLQQMNDSKEVILTTPINLGTLHYPDTFTVSTGSVPGDIQASWSSELGDNGNANDDVVFVVVAKESSERENTNAIQVVSTPRHDGSLVISSLTSSSVYEIYAYLVGNDSASGLLSVANVYEASAD